MPQVKTVRIKADNRVGYKIIDEDAYNRRLENGEKLELADEQEKVGVGEDALTDEERLELRREERKRRIEANRGIIGGDANPNIGRNADGTFSEPTPTDVRYSDKTKTEFANNLGAFVGRSAAELREEKGIPQEPGGLAPKEHAARVRKRDELAVAERRGFVGEEALVKDAVEENGEGEGTTEDGDVAIPMNWKGFNAAKKKALAAKITGEDEPATAAEAEEIIQEELDNRESA